MERHQTDGTGLGPQSSAAGFDSISEPVLYLPLKDELAGLPSLQDLLMLASVLALAWLALE
jgi:hypothetical protein